MKELVLIVHNVRSAYNVGSLLRSADGLGVKRVYLTGYSPYPLLPDDERLPHEARKTSAQIAKTALGAEKTLVLVRKARIEEALQSLRKARFQIAALEQAASSVPLNSFRPGSKLALIVGNEVTGVNEDLLDSVDIVLEIPMQGQKESLNVASAAAIAMYALNL